jgi:serine/threonine protein kinase
MPKKVYHWYMEANGEQGGERRVPAIAGYDAVRWLGGGAQGSVWLVQPEDGSAPLAAKCYLPGGPGRLGSTAAEVRDGRNNASEITQEWRILAHYDHEHLLRIHGVARLGGAWEGGCALLMDHAAGGSVRDIVAARGPLTVGEVVTILTPLGQVLSFLQGNGVVHGDVSPGNVLLTAHGKPVLGDLGFGRMVGQGQPSGGGTPGFHPPSDGQPSAATDVYGMAAVGWFALTGQPPPATRDRMPLSMHVPGVPVELAAALEAALAENAGQRPTAAAFAQAVFRSARAEPVALAASVHPSVLPDLLTRRAQQTRPRPVWGSLAAKVLKRPLHLARPKPRRSRKPQNHLIDSAPRGPRTIPRKSRWLAGLAAMAVIAGTLAGWQLTAGVTAEPGRGGTPGGAARGAGTVAVAGGNRPGQAPLGPVAARVPPAIRDALVSTDPATALSALAWLRSFALSNAELPLLEAVNAAGSPAMLADAAIARSLVQSGHTLAGLDIAVEGAQLAQGGLLTGGSDAPTPTATVTATVITSPFAEQDSSGTVVHRQDAERRQRLSILLVQVNKRWVIQEILP